MVTIYHKNLLASCLFLLGYTSFFLLAVSGSYDYTASGALVRELEPSKPEKYHSEWLSNHEWDYPSLKGNYHSRRKSRSTSEKETSRAEGAWTEETSRGARGKWVPRRKRKFERSVGPESIGNASGFVQEEKKEGDTDAIETTTVTVEPIEDDNNLENETMNEVSNDTKGEENNHLKDELSVQEGNEKNATEILGLRSGIPWFPTELGQEGLDVKPEDEGSSTQRWGSSSKISSKEFSKEILRRKHHRHRKGRRKGGVPDIEFENSDYDEEEEEEEEEGMKGEEEKPDVEKSSESDQEARNSVPSYDTKFLKLISDLFFPTQSNDIGTKHYPWKALTSSQYTKETMKQEGPHLKTSMKEIKSKVNVFFANDKRQTTEGMHNPMNPSKIDNSLIMRANQLVPKALNRRNESIEVTTNVPIKVTTNQSIKVTTTEPMIVAKKEDCEPAKENLEKSLTSNKKDESQHTIYHIFNNIVLFVRRILYLRDQPISTRLVLI